MGGAWRFVSDMIDNPLPNGIYQTSKCYEQIHDFVVEQKQKALTQHTQSIIEMIEGMRRTDDYQMSHDHAYDEAIDDIQTALKASISNEEVIK